MKLSNEMQKRIWAVLQQIELFCELQDGDTDISYFVEVHGYLPSPTTQYDILDILSGENVISIGEDLCAQESDVLPVSDSTNRFGVKISKNSKYDEYYKNLAKELGVELNNEHTLVISLEDNQLIVTHNDESTVIKKFQEGRNGLEFFRYVFNGRLGEKVTLSELMNNNVKLPGVVSLSQFINSLKIVSYVRPFIVTLNKTTFRLNNTVSLEQQEFESYIKVIKKNKEN